MMRMPPGRTPAAGRTWSGTGPLNNTMHYTNATGATATFTFQAPAKFILYLSDELPTAAIS